MFRVILIFLLLFGTSAFADVESELKSLVQTERDFARTSKEKGIREAFLTYLAEDSLLFRPHPVPGKEWYSDRPPSSSVLTWFPTHAEVSLLGDLGWTTGPWEFSSPDGSTVRYGHFITIWKKQPDGSWKAMMDVGISHAAPASEIKQMESLPKSEPGVATKDADVKAEETGLMNADLSLSESAVKNGIVNAFLMYITNDARLYRDENDPAVGKEAIQALLSKKQGTYRWKPIKANVAQTADLGYTYGSEEYTSNISDTKPEQGYYMRIWRKQEDRSWMLVLDVTTPAE